MKPKVLVNVAMSADGKIALSDRTEVKISGEEDFERVHKLRNRVDAILVGIGTVLADDPKLTVKEKYVEEASHPLKVVLDSEGRTPEDAQLFDKGEWLIATTKEVEREGWIRCGERDRVDLDILMEELSERGVEELLVEGGGEVISSFFEEGLVDEFSVFVGSLVIGGKDAPTPVDGEGAEDLEDTVNLKFCSYEEMDDGILLRYEVDSG
ncbi:MAG: 2,5-diamino-6-(ribosylamino)-4(3H)-pyrimidinone 5'-phosphate reductase [Candidatus Thermoplasmatota archaeon]|nr:2,5-diamino-6-(ribosylamino)-4(3H)-pyrimidinone 5'-phosphate reductase [Candidatus Thermoplasmatota archaeon]MBS3789636.1 2,5-diamino-6-(ribosylamino)-4(3H)-pyrimidinone 5'-phosphate reductase [Candidatus Thermoplasmatota archaeon]